MLPARREILSWLHRQRDFFWILFLPVSWIWCLVALLRRAWRRPELQQRFPVKVISVGNIHSGGSGKTPFVVECIRAFSPKKCAVVTRGYGGTNQGVARVNPAEEDAIARFGEEPVWLAETSGTSVYVAPVRSRGIQAALAENSPDLILLDDGFQHLKVYRDVDVVLINTDKRVDESHCLPLGDLREPLSALKKATAVGLIRGKSGSVQQWTDQLKECAISAPVFEISRVPAGLYRGKERVALSPDEPIVAFCGIGSPESFLADLSTLKEFAAAEVFPDHHIYTRADLARLSQTAARVGARKLVCTEKDAIKLRHFPEIAGELLTLRIQYEIPKEFWYFLQSFMT